MCQMDKYRNKKIKSMDFFEVQAIGERILHYIEQNKYELIFKTAKDICKDLNVSHYKYKFYLEVYKKYISETKILKSKNN